MFSNRPVALALPVSVASWAAVLLARVPPARAFASCPPPRFDTFADATLGKWQFGPNIPDQAREVEEVMRSCGGAVQGITEIALPTAASSAEIDTINDAGDQQGRYHNRADDGFIYFDSGSYSAGPILFADDDSVEFMASLSFASTLPKRRLLVSVMSCRVYFTADGTKVQLKPSNESNCGTTIGLSRVPFRQPEDVDMAESPSVQDLQAFAEPGHAISWQKETICKMASPSQPWMLQRAKWESFVNEAPDTEAHGEHCSEKKPTRSDLKGWVRMLDDGEKEIDCVSSNALAKEGLAIQIGALCTKTKEASAVVRCYDTKGKLQGVILQEGMIIEES